MLNNADEEYTMIRNNKITDCWKVNGDAVWGYKDEKGKYFEGIVAVSREQFNIPEGVVVFGNYNGHWKMDAETWDLYLEVCTFFF